jgi:hypothetical protein
LAGLTIAQFCGPLNVFITDGNEAAVESMEICFVSSIVIFSSEPWLLNLVSSSCGKKKV